ncbi:Glucose-6-phosphate phosphate translocator [Musa troglodytarum]|nr:Glucose-6-phosphate phosphate translocator [Musa troglodytarum]
MNGKPVSGMNYYACPYAISADTDTIRDRGGRSADVGSWLAEGDLTDQSPFCLNDEFVANAVGLCDSNLIRWVTAQGVIYHLYNQVSYMSLDEISPLAFSTINTMKRISVIVSSIIIFHTPVQPINALGAAIAILVTFLYFQVTRAAQHYVGSVYIPSSGLVVLLPDATDELGQAEALAPVSVPILMLPSTMDGRQILPDPRKRSNISEP